MLADLRGDADLVIDTTSLNVHQLTRRIRDSFGSPDSTDLRIRVVSFGFKYGIPVDADYLADMRFLPNPHWIPDLRPHTGRDPEVSDYVLSQPGAAEFLDGYLPVLTGVAEGYLREGKRFMRVAIGCTGGKHRSVAMTEEVTRRLVAARTPGHLDPPRPGSRVMPGSHRSADRAQSVVALGGGHGLHASLRALRQLVDEVVVDELTAVVTVADNGGSSGRLRGEFGVLPPGDLRMALAALCGEDQWGQTWERVLQHRFAGDGEMHGHVVGNLLIVALWEQLGDHVQALDLVGRLLGSAGRVLPMALTPLDITAQVRGLDPADEDALTLVRGQVEVATTGGVITRVDLEPASPRRLPRGAAPPSPTADWVVLGPGSWFSSGHPAPARPRPAPMRSSRPTRASWWCSTSTSSRGRPAASARPTTWRCWSSTRPSWPCTPSSPTPGSAPTSSQHLREVVAAAGARLVVADVASDDGTPRHDPAKLAAAYESILLGAVDAERRDLVATRDRGRIRRSWR